MKLKVSVEMFSVHTFLTIFFLIRSSKTTLKTYYLLTGRIVEGKQGGERRGKWEDQVSEETLMQLLDDDTNTLNT